MENNWGGMSYRSFISPKVSAWLGTFNPFILIRCRRISGVDTSSWLLSAPSSSCPVSNLLFFLETSKSFSTALRFPCSTCAYLKKFNAGGRSGWLSEDVDFLEGDVCLIERECSDIIRYWLWGTGRRVEIDPCWIGRPHGKATGRPPSALTCQVEEFQRCALQMPTIM